MTRSGPREKTRFAREAETTARRERAIQETVDRRPPTESKKPKGGMQAGARRYPAPPLPAQHLKKPGREGDLELRPMYDAPAYKGSDKLLGMAALITGADSGIGRAVAVLFAREGADVAIAAMVASTGVATAKQRHHLYRHAAPNAQMGQPGAYGSSGNMTPGYSSTARHKPTDTNGGGGGSQ